MRLSLSQMSAKYLARDFWNIMGTDNFFVEIVYRKSEVKYQAKMRKCINKYENQNVEPDISTLIKIADYFSTTVDSLVGRAESMDGTESIVLTHDEHLVISGYRFLNDEEKQIVRLVINNHRN